MSYKYGIDFGTTNTSIAIVLSNRRGVLKPNVLLLDPANTWGPAELLRSVFYVDKNDVIHVASDADECMDIEEHAGCFSADRYITQLKMELDTEDKPIFYAGKTIQVTTLLTSVFSRLKNKADKFARDNGISLQGVVIGVPVSFREEYKRIYLKALCDAGYYSTMSDALRLTEFVSEPVAVAVNYGEKLTDNKRIMVFDYGGGTLDIAVMDLREQIGKNDKLHPHQVIGKSSGYNIGGERLNKEFFINCLSEIYGVDKIKRFLGLHDNNIDTAEKLWDRMKGLSAGIKFYQQVDRCKQRLSSCDSVEFIPPDIRSPGISLPVTTVTRTDFIESTEAVFREVEKVVRDCLESCKNHVDNNGIPDPVYPNQISEVLLAGGSSLIPTVKDILSRYFDRDIIGKNTENKLLPENEVLQGIVRGLAIIGFKTNDVVEDVVDCSYGIWDDGKNSFSQIIPRMTPISSIAADEFDDTVGMSKEYELINSYADSFTIKLMQRTFGVNNYSEKILKEVVVALNRHSGSSFKLYLSIDKKLKMLVLKVFSVEQHRFYYLRPDQSKVKINL